MKTLLGLTMEYMDIVYSGQDMQRLESILSEDCGFVGPWAEYDSANAYIRAMEENPLVDASYQMLNRFVEGNQVCLVYQFSKPGVSIPMVQVFETQAGRIHHIRLIFDTTAF